MIKFYNPFKPHVVVFNNGKFGLRKYALFNRWFYYDQVNTTTYWWFSPEFIQTHCQVDSLNKLRRPFTAKFYKE